MKSHPSVIEHPVTTSTSVRTNKARSDTVKPEDTGDTGDGSSHHSTQSSSNGHEERVTQGIVDTAGLLEQQYGAYQQARQNLEDGVEQVNQAVADVQQLLSQTSLGTSGTPSKGKRASTNAPRREVEEPKTPRKTPKPVATSHSGKHSPMVLRGVEPRPVSHRKDQYRPAYPGSTVDMAEFRQTPAEKVPGQDVSAVAGNDDKKRLIKKFPDIKLAKRCYDDCAHWEVFQVMAEPWVSTELFIVVVGVKPGVYAGRGRVFKEGLRWRGGQVIRVLGSLDEAEKYYQWMVDERHIEKLDSFVPDNF
ncbi:hypothetical protein VNI00_016489 [Paramarasmius palmivorus]|uniref:Uncharacterized protein n=1 Tax=Paramarasmius palmivorus TaxID=297713 RepID=A0AAW0BFT9_9AGAR